MTRAVIAVDVGGTAIKAGRVRGDTVLTELSRPTPVADGPAAVVEAIRTIVRDLIEDADGDAAAIGVIAPGEVDDAAGIFRYSANLGWRDVPMRELLTSDVSLPIAIGHDVSAAGLAEAAFGATRGARDSLLVMLGTGVAGFITVGGQPHVGARGLGGEIGHIPVWPDGEACPCGQRGCLERYASAAAVARHYEQRSGRSLSAAEVAARLDSDEDAAAVWLDATTALGMALATATMLIDPELIVLGGGLSAAGGDLLTPVAAEVTRRVTWRPVPRLGVSTLGSRAGLLGAALAAQRHLDEVGRN